MDGFLGRNLPWGAAQMAAENVGRSPSQELEFYEPRPENLTSCVLLAT